MIKLLVLVIAMSVCTGDAAKILCIFSIPSRSHGILMEPLFDELAKRGHELTVVTPYVRDDVKYTQVDVSELIADVELNFFKMRSVPLLKMTENLIDLSWAMAKTPNMQKLIKSGEKYDMVFGEVCAMHGLMMGFAYRSNASVVAISTFQPNQFANDMVGNPAPASYIPDSLSPLSSSMSFTERLLNTLSMTFHYFILYFVYYPLHDNIMKLNFGQDLPSMVEISRNTSLVLVNNHFALSYPRPYTPNMIEVGGMHVRQPKPLPQEYKDYLDQATDGVVYFILGSNAKSKDMGEDKIERFLDAFSRLKIKVLWKFEGELKERPVNVKISKWVPQSDILAHPNIKLFMTHGGLLSTTEAIVRGVPIIGIPLVGDQLFNMKQAESNGIGKTLDFDTLTSDVIVETINEVLNNPIYTENVKCRSQLLKDSPMTPMESAVFWMEYVLRHKGAHHMRSAAQDLHVLQYKLLDVYGVVCLVVVVSYCMVRALVKYICRSNSRTVNKLNKKKKE